jgi:4-hydroxythreonine-4-phosphate dehydrogenase
MLLLGTSGSVQLTIKECITPLDCLNAALAEAGSLDWLLTLPMTKGDFIASQLGHTEYLRHLLNQQELTMAFIGANEKIALITDHMPLKDVSQISTSFIEMKLRTIGNSPFFCHAPYLVLSGINPHAGESGLLGREELQLADLVQSLNKEKCMPLIKGPLSGDTLHYYNVPKIYFHHDQGLSYFKGKAGLLGANVTLGTHFTRLSPDHGTAEHLYLKNKANFISILWCLRLYLGH